MKQTARTKADCAIYCSGDTLNGTEHATRSAAAQLRRPAFRMHANDAVAENRAVPAPRGLHHPLGGEGGWGEGRKKGTRKKKERRFAAFANRPARLRLVPGISICFRFIESSFIRGLLGSTDFLSLSLSLSLSLACEKPASSRSSPGVNLRARSPFRIRFTAAARRSHSTRLLVAYEGAMGGGGESEDCVTHREQVSESFRCIVPTGTKFAK